MATFYILPPRERLEQAVVEFVMRALPGLEVTPAVCDALLAGLELEANRKEDAYFVHREDLIGHSHLLNDLVIGFGAEPGDTVLEVGCTAQGRPAAIRRMSVPSRVSGGTTNR